ncbi:MAG: xylulokinase, partial [Bacteroidota bacterium]
MNKLLLGLDIGSSSVKACLVTVETGKTLAMTHSPAEEMPMESPHPGWAEQDPDLWWQHVVLSVRAVLLQSGAKPEQVTAIGISYQMHGLVVVGEDLKPLRPAIIWCDSRAVKVGHRAFGDLGHNYCFEHFLNSPGNFTASKLRWIREQEPGIYERIYKIMLPGDYIAFRLTGEINTTDTGMSEGIFWDYQENAISKKLLAYYEIDENLLPAIVPVFSEQGELRGDAAKELGLVPGTLISYRAGDQPNNAFSLNVIKPGETAATAGTSGVIYCVTDKNVFDPNSRVNTFIHVANTLHRPMKGVLLCINGTGILNSWLRRNVSAHSTRYDYDEINKVAAEAPIGSAGLSVLPFGNGAERILQNKNVQCSWEGLDFNRHGQAHLFRAAQEGIVFALKYGFEILQGMGLHTEMIKAGYANMFLSPLFREAFVNTMGSPLQLYDSDGAKGAALGAGVGAGIFASFKEAFAGLQLI